MDDSILVPVSFETRKPPYIEKVKRDSELMYRHARYGIVLNDRGQVAEIKHNKANDGTIVDCLAVFAPFEYSGNYLEKVLVLEIGFRRFVPYAKTEYRHAAPKKRSRGGKQKKSLITPLPKKRNDRTYAIQPRIPVAALSKDSTFDLLPAISLGIQVCVDDFVRTWTGTKGSTIRWAPSGNEMRRFWNKHEMEPTINVRIPKDAEVLCATATFAEFKWRLRPGGPMDATANAIKDMLKYFLVPGKRRGRDTNGNYEDDFVRRGSIFQWVAQRLKKKVDFGYSDFAVEGLFDCMGRRESIGRKLIEQIWRVHKVPKPKVSGQLHHYQSLYGEMKDLLLERWHIQNFQSLRREINQKEWQLNRTSKLPYAPHATNSEIFSVVASKEVQAEMMEAYCAKRALEAEIPQPVKAVGAISYISKEDDDDIPWEAIGTKKDMSPSANDDIPF